jgi:hypothetical protein
MVIGIMPIQYRHKRLWDLKQKIFIVNYKRLIFKDLSFVMESSYMSSDFSLNIR